MNECTNGTCGWNKITVHREIKCPKCGTNNIYEGVLNTKFVTKVACQCGEVLTVNTPEEIAIRVK